MKDSSKYCFFFSPLIYERQYRIINISAAFEILSSSKFPSSTNKVSQSFALCSHVIDALILLLEQFISSPTSTHPRSIQICLHSRSGSKPASSLPPKYVTYRRSKGMPNSWVSSSRPILQARCYTGRAERTKPVQKKKISGGI